jgi:hypothetical protein
MARRLNDKTEQRSNILVSVEDGALGRLDDIAAQLRAGGMKVTGILKLTGLVTGEAKDKDLGRLRRVPGVSSLEIDSVFTAS